MKTVLANAGRTLLRTFVSNIIVYAPGILQAPNLNEMYLLGVAGLASSLSAALRAVQSFVPQLSWSGIVPQPWAAWADAFTIGAVGTFVVAVADWLSSPDLSVTRALVTGLLTGALAAGFRALEGLGTKGEEPAPDKGLAPDGR